VSASFTVLSIYKLQTKLWSECYDCCEQNTDLKNGTVLENMQLLATVHIIINIRPTVNTSEPQRIVGRMQQLDRSLIMQYRLGGNSSKQAQIAKMFLLTSLAFLLIDPVCIITHTHTHTHTHTMTVCTPHICHIPKVTNPSMTNYNKIGSDISYIIA